jgi:hypothetical protein
MGDEHCRRVPAEAPAGFIPARLAKVVVRSDDVDRRAWELCLLSEMRAGLRAVELTVAGSRRYALSGCRPQLSRGLEEAPQLLVCGNGSLRPATRPISLRRSRSFIPEQRHLRPTQRAQLSQPRQDRLTSSSPCTRVALRESPFSGLVKNRG